MSETQPTPPTPGAAVLVVEDSRTQAQMLQLLLRRHGFRTTVAADGSQALAAARGGLPDLVVSDVEMPVMGGYEMCRAMKDDPALRDVPVVLLTGLSDPSDVLRGLEAGADYYLTKPYDDANLLSTVESALANPSGGGPAEPLAAVFDGRRHVVTSGRRQILTLLLSTYGNAVQRNRELARAQQDLRRANAELTEQARRLREGEERLREQNRRLEELARSERAARETLEKAQSLLVQSEKLASLGQMVAGVAHEINNPLAFAGNNLAVVQRDLGAVSRLLEMYQQARESTDGERPRLLSEIDELCEQVDLAYTLPNLQDLLSSSRDGLRRIKQIVEDLREFARLDESDLSEVDVRVGVEATVNVVRNRAAGLGVAVESEPSPAPRLSCYPARINQVVMNLINNAVDASPPGARVTVRTGPAPAGPAEGGVRIEVIDRGSGIDPAVRGRIFDPFFTTKPQGKGTGLGLSIAWGIVQSHGGTIEVESEPGSGSRFSVLLPPRPPAT